MPQYHAKQKQQQQQLHDIWAHFVFSFPGFLIPRRINWTAATTATTRSKWNPMDEEKRKKKNEAKSKIAIFDGLFSCLLHLLLGGAAIMYWRWNNLNSHRSHRSSQHTPCLSPSPSPSASSPKQMKGSRLKVQTDIIYRSNHLVAATTTSDPKSIKKETGQVLPSSRDLKLTLNQPPSSIPLLLLCLLSCNKWKTSSPTTTGTTLHIIFVGAAAAAIGF